MGRLHAGTASCTTLRGRPGRLASVLVLGGTGLRPRWIGAGIAAGDVLSLRAAFFDSIQSWIKSASHMVVPAETLMLFGKVPSASQRQAVGSLHPIAAATCLTEISRFNSATIFNLHDSEKFGLHDGDGAGVSVGCN